jgi:hypothetical protein
MSDAERQSQSSTASELPGYERWRESWGKPELSLWDYLNHRGDPELAVAFGRLYFPDLVERAGCVFLSERLRRVPLDDWISSSGGDRRRLEAAVNEVHVADLFTNSDAIDLASCQRLAELLQKAWALWLSDTFPDRAFRIDLKPEPEAYGPTLTFWQE